MRLGITRPSRSDRGAGAADPAHPARRRRGRVHHRVLERRELDPRALGASRRRARGPRRARRQPRCPAEDVAGGEPRAVRRRRGARRAAGAADGLDRRALRGPLLDPRARSDRRLQLAVGRRRAGDGRGRPARVCSETAVGPGTDGIRPGQRQPAHHARHQSPLARVRHHASRVFVRAAGRRRDAARHADRLANREHRLRHAAGAGDRLADADTGHGHRRRPRLLSGSDAPDRRVAGRGRRVDRQLRAVARCRQVRRPRRHFVRGRGVHAGRRRGESARPPARRRAGFLQRDRRAVACRPGLHR